MKTTILVVALMALSLWVLWLFFLAVMSLKRAQQAGLLSMKAKIFGYPAPGTP